jgi:hypothetical protein
MTARPDPRSEFTALVFAFEEACEAFGMAPTAENCERVRIARRMVVAAFDRSCLYLTTQSSAA